MKHLTDEELVEHYYAGDRRDAETVRHLEECGQCSETYEEIAGVLGMVHAPEAPARPSGYGAQVWQRIQGPLPLYESKRKRRVFFWPQFAYAAAGLLLLVGTFFAGKLWERTHTQPMQARAPQQVKERVVLFVLNSHLDRSERLLVQLNHASDEASDGAGGREEAVELPLQSEARQLLSDNRLYRQSVAQSKDPLMASALDHLERVLLEVANSPDKLDGEEIARIEKELNTDGLLFEIRVLRARVSEQQAGPVQKGRTI